MTRLVTKDGLKKLQDELEERKTKVRQEIAQAIKEAKEQGDLSENAEYSEAKRLQSENETRISELDMMIKEAQVVAPDKSASGIQIGSVVKIVCNKTEYSYAIVSSHEADPASGKISHESPIGKALIGKKAGDEVSVGTPGGTMKCKVISFA